ncbi:hypothetical protein BS50DRAFT_658190 [Corynespora cassiicola Philippines]|uniref:Indole-diterpene biosynthesis protein-like protein PaxU n=1 Tax=Corynespora cassiicola Philippines TaxID=1448308 RepID=A0A2T2P463_CORCC|nr:hypothetical protein BS50DRAFT_658190 [Corynespora cassiicola Philippines]
MTAASFPLSISKIIPELWLYTPQSYQKGHLIILFMWMAAADKHINKYLSFHAQNFPTAKILLIKCPVISMLVSYPSQRKAMRPAVSAVLAHIAECGYDVAARTGSSWHTQPQILLHVVSTRGLNSATQLFIQCHQEINMPLPLCGILLDSAPPGVSYWKGYNAFTGALPKTFPINILTGIGMHILLILLQFYIAIGRYGPPEDLWRDSLLDEGLHNAKWIAYVYSKADQVVNWEDSKQAGWNVSELMYEDTKHCNHLPRNEAKCLKKANWAWGRAKL